MKKEKKTNRTNAEVAKEELLDLRSKNPQKFSGLLGQLAAIATHWVSTESLEKIKNRNIPIMILTASKDRLVRSENSYILKKHLDPVRFVDYEGSGHMIHTERSREVNEELRHHFQRVTKRPAKL